MAEKADFRLDKIDIEKFKKVYNEAWELIT